MFSPPCSLSSRVRASLNASQITSHTSIEKRAYTPTAAQADAQLPREASMEPRQYSFPGQPMFCPGQRNLAASLSRKLMAVGLA